MAGVATFAVNQKYIIGGDMSSASAVAGGLGATIVGPWIDVRRKKTIWAQAQYGGTPTGTWGLQMTSDPDPIRDAGQAQAMGASTVPASASMTAANPAGGAVPSGGVYFEASIGAVPWARWVYTRSAGGTASLNMAAGTKDI